MTFKHVENPDLGRIDAYDYELSDELIAMHPTERRDQSRLLVAARASGEVTHGRFDDLSDYLRDGDLLVFNDTSVIPGRVLTRKETGGQVELLILDVVVPDGGEDGGGRWSRPQSGSPVRLVCMTKTSKALRPGMMLQSEAGPVFKVEECSPGSALVSVAWTGSPLELVQECGEVPLPPYIVQRRRRMGIDAADASGDRERYQTVYARSPGAIAAPTAGLHFTPALLAQLEERGVSRAFVSLKIGPGTFKPITVERLADHQMHSEEYEINAALGPAIERARNAGGRVIAVGTTSARVLEAEARRATPFEPGLRDTDIFLLPGKRFKVCDGLITNFHLPRSTLLAMVACFAGYDLMTKIYAQALEKGYRFYSYGDSSLII